MDKLLVQGSTLLVFIAAIAAFVAPFMILRRRVNRSVRHSLLASGARTTGKVLKVWRDGRGWHVAYEFTPIGGQEVVHRTETFKDRDEAPTAIGDEVTIAHKATAPYRCVSFIEEGTRKTQASESRRSPQTHWSLVVATPFIALMLAGVATLGVLGLIDRSYAIQGVETSTDADSADNAYIFILIFSLPIVVFAATLPPLVRPLVSARHKAAADRVAFGTVVAACVFWSIAVRPAGIYPAAVALLLSAFVLFIRPDPWMAVLMCSAPISAMCVIATKYGAMIG